MSLWRALLTVLVVALFATGGIARAAPMEAVAPCHETQGHDAADHGAPDKPRPSSAAVNCCAGCMPASPISEAAADASPALQHIALARPTPDILAGRAPEPEPRPPRARAA
jgi:hypothetical protein